MMRRAVKRLGSVRLAFLGMIALAVGAALSYGNPQDTSIWVLVVPLAVLSVNLAAAIATNPRIYRRKGLLVFHVSLLAVIVGAAVGRLTFFEGRIEMLEGNPFSVEDVIDVRHGIFHRNRLSEVVFVQGGYTVQYRPGLNRGLTHSHLLVSEDGRWQTRIVGDDRPLVVGGYRFYTTFNKGFAPLLTWEPEQGEAVSGAIHMPSYPLFEHRQDNRWTPPGGKEIKFWLRLDTGLDREKAWVLDGRKAKAVLVVNENGRRAELLPGQSVRLEGGTLRFERLLTWMGYKIFYDPTLYWMFGFSMLAVAGLFSHYWRKFGLALSTPVAGTTRSGDRVVTS